MKPAPQVASLKKPANWQEMMFPTKEMVDKYIANLREQNIPENDEVADTLQSSFAIEPELTANQKRLVGLMNKMTQKKVPQEIAQQFYEAIVQIVHQNSIKKLMESMSVETRSHWDEIMDSDPNIFQIAALLNYYCKAVNDMDFDAFIDQELGFTLDSYVESLENDITMLETTHNKTPKQMKQIAEQLKSGDFDAALLSLYKQD